jgi:hypothetical protein
MNRRIFLLTAAALLAAGVPAQAQGITITIIPALAPNAYGSPYWSAWVSNATTAIINGYSSYGDPSLPSFYQRAPAAISVTNDIVTGFPSWNGLANPGAVYGASFAGEYGNRIQFGIDIKGGTNLISISQLSFSAHSSDASNSLDFAFAPGSYNYSASYVGIIYGPITNTYITSGSATQLVNEIVGRGSGNAWDTYDTSGNIASQQSNIDLLISQLGSQPFNFTGTYTIAGVSNSGSVAFNPVVTTNAPASGSGSPLLSIRLTDPPESPGLDNMVVSWPAAAGFELQTNTDLMTTNWGGYLGTVDNANGTNSVTLPKSSGVLFFRLKH